MGNEAIGALFGVLKAAGGFFVVMSVWLGIQAFARRKSGCARDRDMLDYMLHGCANCLHGGNCDKSKEAQELPDAAPGVVRTTRSAAFGGVTCARSSETRARMADGPEAGRL
jgi:hypothetical protein